MEELTKIQQQIFDFIIDQKEKKGMPPTLSEIANKFNYSTRTTVQQHLNSIMKKGYIKRNPKSPRGIEVLNNEAQFKQFSVLGEAAAGNPLTIYPEPIDSVQLPRVARIPDSSFLIRVKGDSLKEAYIFNGDFIIVNPAKIPTEGQIIVAIIDDAAVVKRYYKKNDIVELHSENPEYPVMTIDPKVQTFKIAGVVVGVYRKME